MQAQYWHDAHSPQHYRRGSTFIAEINNDVPHPSDRNESYAENLARLDKLVLVRFNNDSMVVPRASSWFEFYAPGSTSKILPLEESAIYKEVCCPRASNQGVPHCIIEEATEIKGNFLGFQFPWNSMDRFYRKILRIALTGVYLRGKGGGRHTCDTKSPVSGQCELSICLSEVSLFNSHHKRQ